MKKNRSLFCVSIVLLFTTNVFGKSGAVGFDEHAKQMVFFQIINVAIFLGILFYFGKKKNISKIFQNRKSEFLQRFEKSQEEMRKAQQQNQQIKKQLEKLQENRQETTVRARAEAADLKGKLIFEAKQLSQKIKEEAQRTSEIEIEKAKRGIRQEMINQAMKMAKDQLATKVSAEDHQRLQGQFINNIGAHEA